MDRYTVVFADGNFVHRHPLKLLVNPILRLLQFFTKRPWLLASRFDEHLEFQGLCFCRVQIQKEQRR